MPTIPELFIHSSINLKKLAEFRYWAVERMGFYPETKLRTFRTSNTISEKVFEKSICFYDPNLEKSFVEDFKEDFKFENFFRKTPKIEDEVVKTTVEIAEEILKMDMEFRELGGSCRFEAFAFHPFGMYKCEVN